MHDAAARTAETFLTLADRLFGERLVGLYVVGSAALGGFDPDRSDLDFVAVLDPVLPGDDRRARIAQLVSGARTAVSALARGHVALPGTCNGVYVPADQLTRPVTEIVPVASHHGIAFERGRGFDVNPVVWTVLARHGIAVRGPAPGTLGLDPEPGRLRPWNLDNLESYWRPYALRALRRRRVHSPWMPPGWALAWTVLGPPRLHCTIATGEIISKPAAGRYALDVFDREWHPVIIDALAWWERRPSVNDVVDRRRRAAEFALHVVDDARRVARAAT